jgi:hypothetical protein
LFMVIEPQLSSFDHRISSFSRDHFLWYCIRSKPKQSEPDAPTC